MILKTLTPKQTTIWIKNLEKVISVYNAVKTYHNANYDKTEADYNRKYGFFGKLWHNGAEFDDLRLDWDGNYRSPGGMFFDRVGKLDTVPPKLCNYKRVLRWHYRDKRSTVLKRLKQKWIRYATQPFQIEEADLEMYQNLHVWHEELKEILVEGGVYDEALNLDEDC